MIGRKDEKGLSMSEQIKTFVGKGSTLEGKMTFNGILRLGGKFEGKILAGDSLVIGETGEVRGQINVKTFIVNGKVRGNVRANNRIEIQSSGEIQGDVQTPVLVISEGGVFEGNCKMVKAETEPEEKVLLLKPRQDANGKMR
jgi:cytoskeletal protein CcmA (bactofilin family)